MQLTVDEVGRGDAEAQIGSEPLNGSVAEAGVRSGGLCK